jgi:hypothetical protein
MWGEVKKSLTPNIEGIKGKVLSFLNLRLKGFANLTLSPLSFPKSFFFFQNGSY